MEKILDDIEELEEDTQKDKYLTFRVDNELYGIDIGMVIEIIGIQPITQVPELPDYIRGIVNLRGKIIPVIDVRMRFRKDFKDYTDRTCVIVIEIKNMSVGLIVDSVSDVLNIPEEEIVHPPDLQKDNNRYIKSIGKSNKDIILLLECDRLLNDKEYLQIQDVETNEE